MVTSVIFFLENEIKVNHCLLLHFIDLVSVVTEFFSFSSTFSVVAFRDSLFLFSFF